MFAGFNGEASGGFAEAGRDTVGIFLRDLNEDKLNDEMRIRVAMLKAGEKINKIRTLRSKNLDTAAAIVKVTGNTATVGQVGNVRVYKWDNELRVLSRVGDDQLEEMRNKSKGLLNTRVIIKGGLSDLDGEVKPLMTKVDVKAGDILVAATAAVDCLLDYGLSTILERSDSSELVVERMIAGVKARSDLTENQMSISVLRV